MFTRRKSIDEHKTVLSGFVGKQDKFNKKAITGKSPSTPKAHNSNNTNSVPSASSSTLTPSATKKRSRPPSPQNCTVEQNKRAHMENSNELNKNNTLEKTGVNNQEQVSLNPELTKLKRQIFAGFETLLAPIKQEIKELNDDQKVLFDYDKSINECKIEKKFVQTE